MIKELVFSGKKYFEGTEDSYIGKTITVPNNHGLTQFVYEGNVGGGYGGKYSLPLKKTKIVAETATMQCYDWDGKKLTDRWVSCGEKDDVNRTLWRRVGEIFEIGGVLASHLTHLYQALHRLFARKVVQA